MSKSTLNKPLMRKWATALESGAYHQCNGQLGDYDPNTDQDTFCCLGVLCVVEGFEAEEVAPWSWNTDNFLDEILPIHELAFLNPKYKTLKPALKRAEKYGVPSWSKSGLTDKQCSKFIEFNDDRNWSFQRIAKHIRKNLLGE